MTNSSGSCRCPVCGKIFANSRALGSHMHYVHREEGVGSRESLDLREDFLEILRDVGIKTKAKTIADIFFDMGGDSIEKLDEVLRLAGITNPQRALILKRWGQRVGKNVPEELLKEKVEEKEDSVFKAYDTMVQTELRELLIEDLRTKIEERKRKLKEETNTPEKVEELLDDIKTLKMMLSFGQQPITYPTTYQQHLPSSSPNKNFFYLQYFRCGYLIPILKGTPAGSWVLCPQCQTWNLLYFTIH